MPTAGRLVSAVCLAFVAVLITEMVKPLMPESTDFGYFLQVNIVVGLLVGWFIMGSRVGRGWTAGINNGFTGVVMLMLWGLLVQSINEMMRLAMRNRYDGPFEAIIEVFYIGADWAWTISTQDIGIALVVCAITVGLISEMAGRRWG
ncbi:MAG: TrgA family protein [Pseudomonadota bacterium]